MKLLNTRPGGCTSLKRQHGFEPRAKVSDLGLAFKRLRCYHGQVRDLGRGEFGVAVRGSSSVLWLFGRSELHEP